MSTGEGDPVRVCEEHQPSCYQVVIADAPADAAGWQGQAHFKWFADDRTWVVAHDSGMTMRWPQQGDEPPAAFLREALPDEGLYWIADEIERIGAPPSAG